MGLFLLVGGNGGVSWAGQYVPSGLTALMVASAPIWMLLLTAVLPGGTRPGWRALAGVAVGFGGIALLFWPGEGSLLNIHLGGAIALLLAALSWSFGSIFSRNLRLPPSPMMGTAAEMLTGGAGLLVLGAVSGDFGRLDVTTFSRESLFGLGYLIVFGSLMGFTAYTWLLRVAPTAMVSTYAYVNPLVLGVVIGDEILSPRALLAAAVILGSVALTTSGRITVSLREEQINRILETSTNNIDTKDALLDEITEIDMQDGILRVYGTYERPDGNRGTGSYDVKVAAENGALNVEIVGGDVEGVELGDRRITRTNEEIAEGLEDSYDRTQGEVEYESVEIDNDSMTIVVNVKTNGRNNP